MKARDQIRRQSTKNNYNTLGWVLAFAISVVILAVIDALRWTWIPASVCIPCWLITHWFLHPNCPFCRHVSHSIAHGIVGKFCENCGESFDRELVIKK